MFGHIQTQYLPKHNIVCHGQGNAKSWPVPAKIEVLSCPLYRPNEGSSSTNSNGVMFTRSGGRSSTEGEILMFKPIEGKGSVLIYDMDLGKTNNWVFRNSIANDFYAIVQEH